MGCRPLIGLGSAHLVFYDVSTSTMKQEAQASYNRLSGVYGRLRSLTSRHGWVTGIWISSQIAPIEDLMMHP